MKVSLIFLIASNFLLSTTTFAQDPEAGMPLEGLYVYRVINTYRDLKATPQYRALLKGSETEIQIEVDRLARLHYEEVAATSERPVVIDMLSLLASLQEGLDRCPPQLSEAFQYQELPRGLRKALKNSEIAFVFDPTTPKALGTCKYWMERAEVAFARWNRLRQHPDWAVSAPLGSTAVTMNPLIVVSQEDGKLKLEVPANLGDRLSEYQKILDESWNQAGDLRVVLVSGPVGQGSSFSWQGFAKSAHGNRAHQFGHLLGFQDCYTEQWDGEQLSLRIHELDHENIMCSPDGKILPLHLEALKAAYLPKHGRR